MSAQGSTTGHVSIVTQTRVKVEFNDAFARWQADTSKVIQSFPGFIEQTVIPPSPPQQVDWVILQRFATEANAVGWLNSPERLKRVNFGVMQVEISVNDPKAYTRPWSVTIEMTYQADTPMIEEICM